MDDTQDDRPLATAATNKPVPTTDDGLSEPTDLFDAICRLDDLVEWLREDWPMEAEHVARASHALKGYIRLSVPLADPAKE